MSKAAIYRDKSLPIDQRLKELEAGLAMACNDAAADLVREARGEIERLATAVAAVSHCSAQNGEDAMAMRKIATDASLWHRPESMWWHGRGDGPPRTPLMAKHGAPDASSR